MLSIWKTRKYLAKKLNLHFLTGRQNSLHFPDSKLVFLQGKTVRNIPDFNTNTDKLIFLHIPKAAGSSVNIFLEVAGKYLKKYYYHCNVRNYNPSIKIIENWQGASQTAFEIPLDIRNKINFLSGHFIFGVNQIFESNCKYFTVIREPIDRELSSINYIYQNGQFNKGENIEQYLLNVLDNPQVKMLAGSKYMHKTCNDEIFSLAVKNLEKHFLLYAPAEKTNELLQALIGIYDLPNFSYYQSNITKKKLLNKIDSNLEQKLLDYHTYDSKLYKLVKEHWGNGLTRI